MDLALLRTFVTVARTGSVTTAARELHLSQASVSRHLQRLESELGTPLFRRRDGRPLEPTAAAQRILAPSEELLATADERWQRLRALAAGRPDRISVLLGPLVTSMPETVETLRRFHAGHPDVDLRIVEQPSGEAALRALRRGDCDLAIRGLRTDDIAPDLETEPLAEMHMHAVLGKEHPLAVRPSIGLADLAGERFVFRAGSDALHHFREVCAAAGIEPEIAHLVDDPAAAIHLLTSGAATTVAWGPSNRAPGPLAHSFKMVRLEAAGPRVMLSAYWLRDRPPPPPAFDLVADARALLDRWSNPSTSG